MIVGQPGVGKSTLINNMFRIDPEAKKIAEQAGLAGVRGTTKTKLYTYRGTAGKDLGLAVCDTPGTYREVPICSSPVTVVCGDITDALLVESAAFH